MNSGVVRFVRLAAVCALASAVAACASNYPTRTVSYEATALVQPETPPSDDQLLNVRIEAFDPGTLPDDPNVRKGLSTDIRQAESYYIPGQLKNAMQRSGQWGQIRVTPHDSRVGEVNVAGKIVESDGEILKLEIDVSDAAGVRWLKKSYESVVDAAAYSKVEGSSADAFQDMYNRIANDIAAHRKFLTAADVSDIRQISELRFGAEFAPTAYDRYLRKTDAPPAKEEDVLQRVMKLIDRSEKPPERVPAYTVESLPSAEDPVVQRVGRIKAREEFLVDTLDQQYEELSRTISGPYTQWRTSRLKEVNAIRAADKVKNQEQAKAVAVGIIGVALGVALASQSKNSGGCYGCTAAGAGVAAAAVAVSVQMAVQASEQASNEADLRRTALEELGNSLATDVKATVVEVEGKTVELKGTIEQKMRAWKEILQSLQELETGPAVPASS